jgi:hypothetical protein
MLAQRNVHRARGLVRTAFREVGRDESESGEPGKVQNPPQNKVF